MQTEINKEAAHTDARGGCRGTLAFDILRIRDPSTVLARSTNSLSKGSELGRSRTMHAMALPQ